MILTIYLSAVGFFGLILMGIDKHRAKRHQWRIPEKTLFLVAALGGSPGVWAGMYLFRHKTKHLSFVLGIPLIFTVQTAFMIFMRLR